MSVEFKPAENVCTIEGILSEVSLREGVSKINNKEYIMGEVKVLTTAEINGEKTELEIPVRVFANKMTNAGKDNPAFDSIKKIQDMASIAACGGDRSKADGIRFENANIQMNEFYGRNEQLVSMPTIRGTFSRKIMRPDLIPTAEFSNVIVVGGMQDETDREGNLTGRLLIKGIVPQWGNKVDIVEYVVGNEAAIKHIQTFWQKGDTVRVAGTVNFSSRVESEVVEMGFGEPEVKHKTISVHEFLITKGSQGALDEEFAYDKDVISQALTERQARLTELKANASKRAEAVAKSSTTDFGF